MKIHIIDVCQLSDSGAQCLIMNYIDKEQPYDSEITITKKAYEGEEFFNIADKLVKQDREMAAYLIIQRTHDRAWKSICNYLRNIKIDEVRKLYECYKAGMYYMLENSNQLLQEKNKGNKITNLMDTFAERVVRQYYPTLGKKTKTYEGLIKCTLASLRDGFDLYTKTNIRFVNNQIDIKVG